MGQMCSCFTPFLPLEGSRCEAHNEVARERSPKEAGDMKKNQNYDVTIQFLLGRVPLLRCLPTDVLPMVAEHCEMASFQKDATVVKQGDDGDMFFLIRKGRAGVHLLSEKGVSERIQVLNEGDYFGEKALLFDAPRTATVIAESPLKVLTISRSKFYELGLNDKLKFPKRQVVGRGVAVRSVVSQLPTEKSTLDRAFIAAALRKNQRLQCAVTLDAERVRRMIDISWKEEVKAGTKIITQGDAGDFFYIVENGTFEIKQTPEDGESSARGASFNSINMQGLIKAREDLEEATPVTLGRGQSVTLGRGESFGEIALLYLVPRQVTVQAEKDSTVWVFDRGNFKKILMQASSDQIENHRKFLDRVPTLESLFLDEKEALAAALVEMHYVENEVIMQQGDEGDSFHILIGGKVSVFENDAEVCTLTAHAVEGEVQFFGEKALLKNDKRTATVKVISPTARTLVLDRESFNLLLGPLQEIIGRHKSTSPTRQSVTRRRISLDQIMSDAVMSSAASVKRTTRERESHVQLDKLVKIGLLGCGGFGKVELFEDPGDLREGVAETYAVKAVSKGYIVSVAMQDNICNERRILMMVDSPFVIKCFGTHNGPQHLHFIMEPGLGGELHCYYQKRGAYGTARHVKYHIAGVIAAFEYLHEHRIIYRDLKPENILMSAKGHVKLADMGLAKFVIGCTYTTCGTPDYFAPEIINSSGHHRAVDWWALGVLTFELMSGHAPFEASHPMKICAKVHAGIDRVKFPQKCDENCAGFIKGLLQNSASARSPMRPGGVDNLRRHPWYDGFDWAAHSDGTMKATYVPRVKSNKDLSNFNPRTESLPELIAYTNKGDSWDKEF